MGLFTIWGRGKSGAQNNEAGVSSKGEVFALATSIAEESVSAEEGHAFIASAEVTIVGGGTSEDVFILVNNDNSHVMKLSRIYTYAVNVLDSNLILDQMLYSDKGSIIGGDDGTVIQKNTGSSNVPQATLKVQSPTALTFDTGKISHHGVPPASSRDMNGTNVVSTNQTLAFKVRRGDGSVLTAGSKIGISVNFFFKEKTNLSAGS